MPVSSPPSYDWQRGIGRDEAVGGGLPWRYRDDESVPTPASYAAAVIVLVYEAIRKWVSARGGIALPSSVVP